MTRLFALCLSEILNAATQHEQILQRGVKYPRSLRSQQHAPHSNGQEKIATHDISPIKQKVPLKRLHIKFLAITIYMFEIMALSNYIHNYCNTHKTALADYNMTLVAV